MRPALQVLIALVLQAVLPSLVKLDHVGADRWGEGFVPGILKHRLVHVVSHEGKGLRLGRRRNLFHEVVSECVLNTRVLQEYGLRPNVEHSVVALDCE